MLLRLLRFNRILSAGPRECFGERLNEEGRLAAMSTLTWMLITHLSFYVTLRRTTSLLHVGERESSENTGFGGKSFRDCERLSEGTEFLFCRKLLP